MKASESRYSKCIYFISNALARKTDKLATAIWKKVNLSPSHAYLLMVVIDKPGSQPTFLSEELHLTPSTITRLIEKLEEKKLVQRSTEGKMTNVFPTQKAKDLGPKLKACANEFTATYTEMLGKEESLKLVHNMAKMADKMD